MRTILIVDDELIARKQIRNIITWENYGYSIVAEAPNGVIALELYQKYLPDIVITDIKMPVMDGLELLKKLHELKADIKVVIISCFEEFAYLKEAYADGAIEYLTKHTCTEQDILNLLNKLDETFLKQDYFSQSRLIMARVALGDWILHPEHADRNSKIDFLAGEGKKIIVCVKIMHENEIDRSWGILQKINVNGCRQVIIIPDGSHLVLFYEMQSSQIDADIFTSRLADAIHEQLFFSVSWMFGVSQVFFHIENAARAYHEAALASGHHLYFAPRCFCRYEEIAQYAEHHDNPFDEKAYCKLIMASLYKNNGCQKVKQEIASIFSASMLEPHSDVYFTSVYESIMHIFRFIIQIETTQQNENHVFDRHDHSFNSVLDMENTLIGAADLLWQILSGSGQYSKHIERIIGFIRQNLAKDISLKEIADSVNLSRVYLSQLFKKETGIPLSDYILNTRLTYAKHLLKNTDMKIYEVASSVGFSNTQYFSSIFKKQTDYTPLEYKKAM